MTVGERIRNARKKAGLTQAQLGEKLGVSGSMIGQYEKDLRKPKIETMDKIATALNCYAHDLFPRDATHLEVLRILDDSKTKKNAIDLILSNGDVPEEIKETIKNMQLDASQKRAITALAFLSARACSYDCYNEDSQLSSLIDSYSRLNDIGQAEALLRIKEMCQIPKYQRKEYKQNSEK
ncbi:helix-turn-helix domain-containing protein [Dysosmobacter sp.]|uniref:helix-turn-helix domain-containing protein n=1 Tax=Dysosmobacter sp. TaxID=2591382 RepID=UPI003FD6DDE2